MTKSQVEAANVTSYLRARNILIWVVTKEEPRTERFLAEAAAAAGYKPYTWDVAQGICNIDGTPTNWGTDVSDALKYIDRASGSKNRNVWIMRDLPVWLAPGIVGAEPTRLLRNLCRKLPGVPRDNAQAIIVITPSADVPPELEGHATVIEWPLPDREEIAAILDAAISTLPDEMKENAAPNGVREAAIDAAVGLSGLEAQASIAKSLVELRKVDPVLIGKEKKRVIAKSKVLEWYDPLPGGLASVGGLENLKTWLAARKSAYSKKAREYGLPAPKGCMLFGHPGTGKSMTAKAIATAWGIPLLRMDLGALKSKFVGESEGNIRKAFKVIEAIGRCVVWLDEIEKALGGATNGAADGGVSTDALGSILSWMQERQGEAFVIATANDVRSLPPELLRKGRFDELWFIDLPNSVERAEIMYATLKTFKRDPSKIDLDAIAGACDTYTGAEIAALVPDAMYAAFADGEREITTDDLMVAADNVTPLAETAADKISFLREWAKGKARPATPPLAETAKKSSPILDL